MKKLITICAVVALMYALSTTAKAETWNVPREFQTIQDAIDSDDVVGGDTILVGPGNHDGATVTKAVEIKGKGGAVVDSGPMYADKYITGFYFRDGAGDGATISHLSFVTVDLPIYSRDTHDVTVEHCTFTSPMQGITNWNGNGWNISHNVINGLVTISGGGIGIFVGTRLPADSRANNNLITHNKIKGQVVVSDEEIERYNQGPPYPEAGYSVPGICLMSDRRKEPAGTISGNRILKNKVALSSNNPRNHFPGGIGLSDLGLRDLDVPDLLDNKIGFNDLRGMLDTVVVEGEDALPTAILLVPDELDESNIISRNLGYDADNRGHGAHPKVLFE
jgi:hypothetical protein